MEFAFYICGLIAILATLRVVTHTNPVHALLYLIISLLAIAGVFFSLGAYFAGALEIIVYAILGINDQGIDGAAINAKEVGIALFGPYVLAVELASMLLLAGLVVAFHIGREERAGEVLSNRLNDSDKRKTEEHA